MKNIAIASNSNSRFDRKFSLRRMFRNLDRLQDIVVFGLSIVLVIKMLLVLGDIFIALWMNFELKTITSDTLFLLILVELFRLMSVYLDTHRIFVGVAVEVAVVSILREIIVEGLLHIEWLQIIAMCSFLVVLGGLMLVSHQVENVEH